MSNKEITLKGIFLAAGLSSSIGAFQMTSTAAFWAFLTIGVLAFALVFLVKEDPTTRIRRKMDRLDRIQIEKKRLLDNALQSANLKFNASADWYARMMPDEKPHLVSDVFLERQSEAKEKENKSWLRRR